MRLYHLFSFTAVLLILLSMFVPEKSMLDLHLRDSYVVISGILILRALALFLILMWLLYHFTKNVLFSGILARLHIIATQLTICCVIITVFDYTKYNLPLELHSGKLRLALPLFIMFSLLLQLLYIINLVLGIIRKTN